jgi:hypothetical protein
VSTTGDLDNTPLAGNTVFRTNHYWKSDFVGDKNQNAYDKMARADARVYFSRNRNGFICFFYNEESLSQYYLVERYLNSFSSHYIAMPEIAGVKMSDILRSTPVNNWGDKYENVLDEYFKRVTDAFPEGPVKTFFIKSHSFERFLELDLKWISSSDVESTLLQFYDFIRIYEFLGSVTKKSSFKKFCQNKKKVLNSLASSLQVSKEHENGSKLIDLCFSDPVDHEKNMIISFTDKKNNEPFSRYVLDSTSGDLNKSIDFVLSDRKNNPQNYKDKDPEAILLKALSNESDFTGIPQKVSEVSYNDLSVAMMRVLSSAYTCSAFPEPSDPFGVMGIMRWVLMTKFEKVLDNNKNAGMSYDFLTFYHILDMLNPLARDGMVSFRSICCFIYVMGDTSIFTSENNFSEYLRLIDECVSYKNIDNNMSMDDKLCSVVSFIEHVVMDHNSNLPTMNAYRKNIDSILSLSPVLAMPMIPASRRNKKKESDLSMFREIMNPL